jgi:hypothetical protein
MAFADPQTVTISGAAKSLKRTGYGPSSGTLATVEGDVALKISHQGGRRFRRTVRLEHSKIAPDPFTSDQTKFSMTAYIVIDTPVTGYTATEAKAVVDGLTAWLTATSGSNVTAVLGSEI